MLNGSEEVLASTLARQMPAATNVRSAAGVVTFSLTGVRYQVDLTWVAGDEFIGGAEVRTRLTRRDPDDGEELSHYPRGAWSQLLLPGTRSRVDFLPAVRAIQGAVGGGLR